jgi:hypothetical protein
MRARNIKPGFYRDADLAECSAEARLIVPGLWMMADREGKLIDNPKQIKMELFPCDDWDCEELLNELKGAKHIIRYTVNGQRIIKIRKFLCHQNPHKNEPTSNLPDENGELDTLREDSRNGASNPADSLIPDSLIPEVNTLLTQSCPQQPADDEETQEKEPPKIPPCPHQKIRELYHEMLPELMPMKIWNSTRRQHLQARWRESQEFQSIDFWERLFAHIKKSDFLVGRKQRASPDKPAFKADLDWIIRPQNFAKIIEGKYDNEK